MGQHAPTGETLKSRGSSASGLRRPSFSVTVGLPVYNDAARVPASVASVMNQTWQGEIRLLIVDDGSTDSTPEVLEQMASRYSNVTVIRHPANRGRAAARNTILRHADSEYLAWIDSDDEWYPEKLEKQFEALRARHDDLGVLCTCPYKLISVDGSEELIKWPRIRGDQLKNCLESTLYPFLWSMLGRTRTFRDVGEFDERLERRQDFEFFLRFLTRGGLVVSTDPYFPLCEYRRTDIGRSGWRIAAANRVIWKRHRRVFARYGWGYAYSRRAAQHALCVRFFKANRQILSQSLFEMRRWSARAIAGVLTLGSVAGMKAVLEGIAQTAERSRRQEWAAAGSVQAPDGPLAINVSELDAQCANPVFAQTIDRLKQEADAALERGPYSVVDKGVATVGTLQDYWFPSPYWWPNPDTMNGRPYTRDANRRLPGTDFYEPGSERFDRARLQRLCDDTLVLALAHHVTGQPNYGLHALALLRRWFIDRETRMNPHLRYAEVKLGHDLDQGTGRGIIQAQAFWYLLEAVRLLDTDGVLDRSEREAIRSWFSEYLDWLSSSRQGRWARNRAGFHGAYYELQVAAIAAFVANGSALGESIARAERKIDQQFEPLVSDDIGAASGRSSRAKFTLLAWANLHYLTRACGNGLWERAAVRGLIKNACERVFSRPVSSSDPDDRERAASLPVAAAYEACFGNSLDLTSLEHEHNVPDPSTLSFHGVRPFWVLGIQCRADFLSAVQRAEARGTAHGQYPSADVAAG